MYDAYRIRYDFCIFTSVYNRAVTICQKRIAIYCNIGRTYCDFTTIYCLLHLAMILRTTCLKNTQIFAPFMQKAKV